MMMAKFVLIIMKFLFTLVLLMLAPTTSYARSSPPLQNYEKSNLEKSNLLSYKDCLHNCNKCACTQIWPPDLSFCVCLDSIQSAEKGKEKSVYMPYKECLQSCESEIECACTLIYPPELSQCICLHPKQPEQVGRRSGGSTSTTTPYRQCVRSCETCACTLVYPPELSECICLDYPAILLNSEITRGRNTRAAGSNGNETSHDELIPFMECIQSCDNCACTRIWPPNLSQCLCLN